MKRQWLRITLGVVSTAALTAVTTLTASAATGDRAFWDFTKLGNLIATDSSANHNNGVDQNIVSSSSGYIFNGHSSRVIVPNSASLNPGTADFSFSVTFVTTLPGAGDDYDMIRKGDGAGEYKIEIFNKGGKAKAFCVARDTSKKAASIWGTTDLNDGKQHTITCSKTSAGASLQVDSLKPVVKNVAGGLGTFTNKNSLVLGAKKIGSGGDWFKGTFVQARVT